MKISEMIKCLQEIMEYHGDLDCWYEDYEHPVYHIYHEIEYEPSVYCKIKYDGEVCTLEDAGWTELDSDDYQKICVVN